MCKKSLKENNERAKFNSGGGVLFMSLLSVREIPPVDEGRWSEGAGQEDSKIVMLENINEEKESIVEDFRLKYLKTPRRVRKEKNWPSENPRTQHYRKSLSLKRAKIGVKFKCSL